MSGITSVIDALITTTLLDKRILAPRENKAGWALLAFSVLCVSLGMFFLALALYQYLESLYLPHIAALASSALVLAAALLALALRYSLRSQKAAGLKPVPDAFGDNIHVLIREICNELEEPIMENPKTSVAVAALAGLLVAHRL